MGLSTDKIEITPSFEEWEKELRSINPRILEIYRGLICLKTKEIEASRANEKLKVFSHDDGIEDKLLV